MALDDHVFVVVVIVDSSMHRFSERHWDCTAFNEIAGAEIVMSVARLTPSGPPFSLSNWSVVVVARNLGIVGTIMLVFGRSFSFAPVVRSARGIAFTGKEHPTAMPPKATQRSMMTETTHLLRRQLLALTPVSSTSQPRPASTKIINAGNCATPTTVSFPELSFSSSTTSSLSQCPAHSQSSR